MPQVITLTNNKGGVGKTTSTVNIAHGLAHALTSMSATEQRVLVIDMDSQCHATRLTTPPGQSPTATVADVLVGDREQMGQRLIHAISPSTWHDNLYVLPAAANLDTVMGELAGVPGAPYLLADALAAVRDEFAFILIDTNPSFSLLTEMSILAATDVLIPIEPRYLETVGLLSAIRRIQAIKQGWRHTDLRIRGVVVTKMDRRMRGHLETVEQLHQHEVLQHLIYGVIPVSEAVSYAHQQHQSVFSYDPRSGASKAYARICQKLLSLAPATPEVK